MNKAVFLDRDGTIIKMIYDLENDIIDTPRKINQIRFTPDIISLLKHTASLGYKNIIVSNQPAIARKKITLEHFQAMQKNVRKKINKEGARIDAEYYCFHHPESVIAKYKKICQCRKPKPGLIYQAARELNIDLKKSWMIGDGVNDVLSGKTAGCKTILLANLYEAGYFRILEEKLNGVKPDYLIKNIKEAIRIIQK